MVVGEAPGSYEVEQGKPFVGKSGKLLRSTLKEFGFTKDNSIISNTIPCRPQDNKFPKDRNVVNSCIQKWLKLEIDILKPKYILLIGSTPTFYLLHSYDGITKMRGKWYTYNNIPCMPTLHPSYVLRKQYMMGGGEINKHFRGDIESVAKSAGFLK